MFPPTEADLAWHVRAWGRWVHQKATADLEQFYPKIDGKPTVAYLWSRSVKCKNCLATIPLLKTKWLCKKDNKRVLLTMEHSRPDGSGLVFGVQNCVPVVGGNAAQRREYDKKLGAGTMSRSGVTCPCCNAPSMTMEDLRLEGKAGGLDADVTVVVVQCNDSREYRAVIPREREVLKQVEVKLPELLEQIPHGELNEPLQPESTRSISCDLYGIDTFGKMFTPRQTLALACFVKATRQARSETSSYPLEWREGIYRLVALNIDRLADRCSTFCRPDPTPTQSGVINTFSKFALSMTWDFIEGVPIANSSGGYIHSLEWIALVVENLTRRVLPMGDSKVVHQSATHSNGLECFDLVMTDPPYYEAISDADLSDFFYVWLKRVNEDLPQFTTALTDKTNEAVQHIRSDKSRIVERSKYESRMAEAFRSINSRLTEEGRFVVVFAHKQPDAWETLVSAMIHAGFVVTGSWPIQTEMSNRGRAIGSASLSSSVWLVCKKRPESARPGWDNRVLEDMRHNIHAKLRDYWDAGIRGPDFVWAATGPALEAYSKHPVVKKANEPGKLMEVSEFLRASAGLSSISWSGAS